ncbi:MAG: glycosyltransferase family 2 protein [Solirubrobacteraceae bacterium]
MNEPAVAVAVASRNRPVRLRWLLNALSEQRFGGRFEVIVAYDQACAETRRLLETHPLRVQSQLRTVGFPSHSTFPGAGRNAAWRATRAPLILFTDDDCRPTVGWIADAVGAAAAHPGTILQGRTLPDPDEAMVLRGAPWTNTMLILPPTPWAQTCNIGYRRELLERLGGFEEGMRVGEDTEIALRAQRAGAKIVAAPGMLVYHAVHAHSLLSMLRGLPRWRDIAWLVKRHPRVRRHMWAAIWWKPEHAALSGALVGVWLNRRCHAGAVLTLPWLALSMRHRGYDGRGILRSITELPGHAAIDGAEIATMARGSLRYRTLLL